MIDTYDNPMSIPTAKVLVVEDNESLITLIQKILKRLGYEALMATKGLDAIEIIEQNNDLLLLLDHNLPDMTGRDVIHRLREKNIEVPFIIMTGQGDEKLAVEIMKLGASDYLIKDNDLLDTLPRVIEKVNRNIEIGKEIKKIQNNLVESEQRYNTFIDSTSDFIFLKDEKFRYIVVNKAYSDFLGMPRESIYGKTDYEIFKNEIATGFNNSDIQTVEKFLTILLRSPFHLSNCLIW